MLPDQVEPKREERNQSKNGRKKSLTFHCAQIQDLVGPEDHEEKRMKKYIMPSGKISEDTIGFNEDYNTDIKRHQYEHMEGDKNFMWSSLLNPHPRLHTAEKSSVCTPNTVTVILIFIERSNYGTISGKESIHNYPSAEV